MHAWYLRTIHNARPRASSVLFWSTDIHKGRTLMPKQNQKTNPQTFKVSNKSKTFFKNLKITCIRVHVCMWAGVCVSHHSVNAEGSFCEHVLPGERPPPGRIHRATVPAQNSYLTIKFTCFISNSASCTSFPPWLADRRPFWHHNSLLLSGHSSLLLKAGRLWTQ